MGRSDLSSAIEIGSYRAEPSCVLCGESDPISFAFERAGNSVYSCRRCRVEFLFPQPTDQTLADIYSENYFLGEKNEAALRRQEFLKRATAKLYLNAIGPFLQSDHPRLLEIGCGSGDFLVEAQSRGFEVEGLEYSEHAAADANARLGRPTVRIGSPESGSLAPNRYDVIGAFDVIEHLRSPAQTLRRLCNALKPHGLIALATPSLDSWSRRALGRHWMEYKTEHLTYFSKASLKRVLQDSGLEVLKISPNYKTLSFDYVSAHFDRYPVPMVSPVVRMVRNALPAKLAHRPVKIVASGVLALAQKRS